MIYTTDKCKNDFTAHELELFDKSMRDNEDDIFVLFDSDDEDGFVATMTKALWERDLKIENRRRVEYGLKPWTMKEFVEEHKKQGYKGDYPEV